MNIKPIITVCCCMAIAACSSSSSSTTPSNGAPTISAISDQNITANGTSAPIAFSVTSASALSYSVSSDNEQVVPNDGLNLVSSASGGSISVSPIVDTLGDAFITIIATDQMGLSTSTSFLITITPQQLSLQQFVRGEFALVDDGMPVLINAVVFDEDADNDDFADLLAL